MAMMKNTAFAALLMSVVAVSGTAQAGHRNPVDEQSNPKKHGFADVHIAPPELARPFERDGVVTDPAIFTQVAVGQSKNELSAVLGTAIQQQSREWVYHFKFAMPASANYLVCQYQVRFDGKGLVKSTTWRRRQCENLARPSAA
jgi:outer membrane protein assembly factor BamE (lipoprotein component of BamABCDE complex)